MQLFAASVASPTESPTSRHRSVAFELGWDYAHRGVMPPVEHLLHGSPIGQGWQAGRQTLGPRTLHADRHVRKWLQTRLHAWLRDRAYELTQVNPTFLRQIDVVICPITREALTHGTGAPSDASVDRVCNDAGYAAGNLSVMSTRANAAKSVYGPLDAMRFARQIEVGRLGEIDGLDAPQWARVAILTSFATRLPHAVAAGLPLLVLPPNRLRVLNPVQALQVLLTMPLARPGHARRVAAMADLFPHGDAQRAFRTFMLTLLARRIATRSQRCMTKARHALEDMWRDSIVHARWRMLSASLEEGECERICRIAAARGLAGPGLQWLSAESPTAGWALETRGYTADALASKLCEASLATKHDAIERIPRVDEAAARWSRQAGMPVPSSLQPEAAYSEGRGIQLAARRLSCNHFSRLCNSHPNQK